MNLGKQLVLVEGLVDRIDYGDILIGGGRRFHMRDEMGRVVSQSRSMDFIPAPILVTLFAIA